MTTTTEAPMIGPRFRVLVADNLESEVGNVAAALRSIAPEIDVTTVTDQAEALRAPIDDYYHAVVVDLRWEKDFVIGAEVLRRFRDYRSAGLLCMMTKYVEKREELITLLRDPGRIADLLYDKSDHGSAITLREVIELRLGEWRRNDVQVDGLKEVIAAVAKKRSRLGIKDVSDVAIEAEVIDLVRDVFGGSLPSIGVAGVSVSLRLMPAGLSSAVLIEATPMLGRDARNDIIAGNRCILKLNSYSATTRESDAYSRSVRFSVALDHRVELLAHSARCRLGLICYSFAGGSTAGVRQLDEVARKIGTDADAAEVIDDVLRSLFSVDSKRWYSIRGEDASIQGYFHNQLKFNFVDATSRLAGWARKLARGDGVHIEDDRLVVGDCGLLLPRPGVFGSEIFRRKWPTCLVHGDLHGGNVMVAADGRASLIDFANAGLGPRYFDAATLHGSVRLWDAESMTTGASVSQQKALREHAGKIGSQLQRSVQLEERLLRRNQSMGGGKFPSWIHMAGVLDQVVEANFGSDSDSQRLATYAAQAARLCTHPNVSDIGRLRCLSWYTALERALAAEGEIDE